MTLRAYAEEMPLNVAEALERYLDVGNVAAVARELGLPRITVQKWSERWQFRAIAQELDDAATRDALAYGRRKWAQSIPAAVDTIAQASTDRFGDDGKPSPGAVTPTALKAAITLVHGSGALASRLTSSPADAIGAAAFDRVAQLLAAGDTAALLALATGQTAPDAGARIPGQGVLPGDFASDQPGGRVVPGTSYGETSALDADGSDVIEAVLRST